MDKGERFNTISHLIGTGLALAGFVALIVYAARQGDPWKIVSFSIYGATLVMLYSFSALYHSFRGRAKRIFQKLDHTAIYLLIAGTYTPFTLVPLRGALGWSLFGVIWGLALIGIILDVSIVRRKRILSLVIYIVMGWLALIAIRPLARAFPPAGLALMVAGGLLYTIGALFYVAEKRVSFGHGIFHLFVLAGSASHYFTILLYVT